MDIADIKYDLDFLLNRIDEVRHKHETLHKHFIEALRTDRSAITDLQIRLKEMENKHDTLYLRFIDDVRHTGGIGRHLAGVEMKVNSLEDRVKDLDHKDSYEDKKEP